ncbi:MAG: response regulator [Chloroflexota bacterium]
MINNIALVVDDDKELANAFKIVLELDNFEVTTLNDSRQALATIREMMPTVLTLDIDMPHVSGIQILEAIQDDVTLDNIKIIMISASRQVSEYQSILERADLVLMKPVTLNQVRDFVKRITA